MTNTFNEVVEGQFEEVVETPVVETNDVEVEAPKPLVIRVHQLQGEPIEMAVGGLTEDQFTPLMQDATFTPQGLLILGKYFIPVPNGIRFVERV